jgi:hypothetical protein
MMIKLNRASTAVFVQLIDKLDIKKINVIHVPEQTPLVIEELHNIISPEGTGKLYSIAQYLPEVLPVADERRMHFIMIDKRVYAGEWHLVNVYPALYFNKSTSTMEESAIISNQIVFRYSPDLQKKHCNQACIWFLELHYAGFLQ